MSEARSWATRALSVATIETSRLRSARRWLTSICVRRPTIVSPSSATHRPNPSAHEPTASRGMRATHAAIAEGLVNALTAQLGPHS